MVSSCMDSATFGGPLSLRVDRRDLSVMSLSPCSRDAVLAGHGGLLIVDLDDPFLAPRWLPHDTKWQVADVQWCPHASHAQWVVSTSNQRALLWNLDVGNHEYVLHGHERAITDINFSPHDPNCLATCSVDSKVLQWDLRYGECVNEWTHWRSSANQVKWHRTDPCLVASAHDNEVLVWDTRKGAKPLRRLSAHRGRINGVCWTDEGLITCSNDGTVKFWSEKDNSPVYTVDCGFPVARARGLPFGEGNCGVMPLREGDNAIQIFNYKGKTGREQLVPSVRFEGHSGPIRDFLWRERHGPFRGIDDREFQLVTWSSDCDLRLWPIDKDMYKKCRFDRNPIKEPFPTLAYKSYRGGSEATQGEGQAISSKRIKRRQHKRIANGINHLSWISGVKLGNSYYNDQVMSLGEEVSLVGHKFPKLRFERISVSTGVLVISLNGPWAQEDDQLIFIRLEINFPSKYPNEGTIRFRIEDTHELTADKKGEMLKGLQDLAAKLKGKCCLEPLLRFLLGEAVHIEEEEDHEGDDDADLHMEDIPEEVMEEIGFASDAGDDSDVEAELFDVNQRQLFDSTPVPKGCGAIWSSSGHLVCFFLPKEGADDQVVKFGQTGFSLVTQLEKKNKRENMDGDEFNDYDFDEFGDGLELYDKMYQSRAPQNQPKLAPTVAVKNLIKTVNFQHLIPCKMELAQQYRIMGDDKVELARYNGEIARFNGYNELAEAWEIIALSIKMPPFHPLGPQGAMVTQMLHHYAQEGNVQMLAMMSSIMEMELNRGIKSHYASMLFEWGLPLNRVKMLKKAPNQLTIDYTVEIKTTDKVCQLCQIEQGERVVVCEKCKHCIHAKCSVEWFDTMAEAECPSGCGCRCLE